MKDFNEIRKTGIATQRINESIDTGVQPINPIKLPTEIVDLINARLGDEYTAHYFYRNAANWCKNTNYNKAAAFFEAEASSELEHAKGLQDYLTQWNLLPNIPGAPTQASFRNLVDIINKAYEMEFGLFTKYSEAQAAILGIHPASFNFIQGYVDIQNTAIAEYSDLLNALQLINVSNPLDVLYFEKEYFG
jgi:ferritin